MADPIPSDVEVDIPDGESAHFSTEDGATVYERTVEPEATITPTYTLVGDDPLDAFDPHREPSVKVMPVETQGSFTRSGAESAVAVPGESGTASVVTEMDSLSATDDVFGMPDDELLISDLTDQSFDGTQATSTSMFEQRSDGGQSEAPKTQAKPDTNGEAHSMEATDEVSTGSDDKTSTESSVGGSADSEADPATDSKADPATDSEAGAATDSTENVEVAVAGNSVPGGKERGSSNPVGPNSSNRDDEKPVETAFEFFGGKPSEVADTSDDVVEMLINSLERGLSDEQRERLRRAIGDAVRPRSSLVVQVRYLQSRFEELAAYIDALEEFIDENGTADELLAEMADELESVQTDVDRIQDQYEEVDTRVEEAETRHDEFRSSVESRHVELESELTDLEESLTDDLRSTETELESRVSTMETSIREDVEELEEHLEDRISSLDSTVDSRISSIEETLEDRVGAVEDTLVQVDETVQALEHGQRDLIEDVDDLLRFRESMQQAFE